MFVQTLVADDTDVLRAVILVVNQPRCFLRTHNRLVENAIHSGVHGVAAKMFQETVAVSYVDWVSSNPPVLRRVGVDWATRACARVRVLFDHGTSMAVLPPQGCSRAISEVCRAAA